MVIDMDRTDDSQLCRMFELRDWDVQEAAREWLRYNQIQRDAIAGLLREALNATRGVIREDRAWAGRVYAWRKAVRARIIKEEGVAYRPTYADLIDAAVDMANKSSSEAERAFFAANPHLPCGEQDSHTDQFTLGRRMAQLYLTAAMML